MTHTVCLVCLASTVSGWSKNPLKEQALVAGTKQNLNNILFLDIYDMKRDNNSLSTTPQWQSTWAIDI
jgi:hypothetical protein